MTSLLAASLILSAAFAPPLGVADVPDPFDTTDPQQYWLLAEANDGMESVYLRQMDLGKNTDDGTYHAYFVITDEGTRVENWQFATQFEIEFNCENHTYAPRGLWHFDVRGHQENVSLMDQDVLIFAPVKPGGPYAMAAKHFCDGESLGGLPQTNQIKVSQLILYQAGKYDAAGHVGNYGNGL